MKKPFSEESRIVCGSEAVWKGQRSSFPVLGFHRPLEPLALQVKASLNEKISHSLLEWPVMPSHLINASWLHMPLHTVSKLLNADLTHIACGRGEIGACPEGGQAFQERIRGP